MRTKKIIIFIVIVIILVGAGLAYKFFGSKKSNGEIVREVKPFVGKIETYISTTGTVLPKNRLEIKPPVAGRIDNILVKEGQKVKTGDTLGWMSSTERAALIDAARGKGEEVLKYWEDVYKKIPLVSPIDGEVIVATIQPGQTVTTADAIVVLSDALITRAQVDETDIGKIKLEQEAVIYLDAYPDTKINSKVDHIYYESKTVNNVTIYEVDLLPDQIPDFFRSGMNATVDFRSYINDKALLIPVDAVQKEKNKTYCLVARSGAEPEVREIALGATDDKNYEVESGLTANEIVIIKEKKFAIPKKSTSSNPLSPFGGRSRRR